MHIARVALDDEQGNGGGGERANRLTKLRDGGRAREHNYVQENTYVHIYIRDRCTHTHTHVFYAASQKRNTGYIKVGNHSVLAFLVFFFFLLKMFAGVRC